MTLSIPLEYKQFIDSHGAIECFTSGDDIPGYVALWSLSEIPENNEATGFSKYVPGFIAFAGDGGGEVLAFDAAGSVYSIPLIGMDPSCAIKMAESFTELAARFELAA